MSWMYLKGDYFEKFFKKSNIMSIYSDNRVSNKIRFNRANKMRLVRRIKVLR
jgi:hypothetical protein